MLTMRVWWFRSLLQVPAGRQEVPAFAALHSLIFLCTCIILKCKRTARFCNGLGDTWDDPSKRVWSKRAGDVNVRTACNRIGLDWTIRTDYGQGWLRPSVFFMRQGQDVQQESQSARGCLSRSQLLLIWVNIFFQSAERKSFFWYMC